MQVAVLSYGVVHSFSFGIGLAAGPNNPTQPCCCADRPGSCSAPLCRRAHMLPTHLSSTNSPTLQGDGEVKKREDVRRKVTAANETLFVVNFDPDQCRERDLERHFGEYGRLRRVQVWLASAFVPVWGACLAIGGVGACLVWGGCNATWESHYWDFGCLRRVQARPSCGGCAYASGLRYMQVWQLALVPRESSYL